ncbi:MAG: sulfotransferase domain-containing protein [Cyanothece sp. SIO1E1]|nr:sulfotransferase domain-containing protein [Cyanothece sp. SIO1E1]
MRNYLHRVQRYFCRIPSNVKVIFPHVPKCGGNSVIKSLQQGGIRASNYFEVDYLDTSICDHLSQNDVGCWLSISSNIFSYKCLTSKANLIVGHAPLVELTRRSIEPTTKVITLLRDPVDRWISNYIYDRYKPSGPGKHNLNIEDYLLSAKGRLSGQYYTYFFASVESKSKEEIIQEAVMNLSSFDLIGFTFKINHFFIQLQELIGFSLDIKQVNQSPKAQVAEAIRADDKVMQKIKSICEMDLIIYQECLKNLST